jgi:hypothetical protein
MLQCCRQRRPIQSRDVRQRSARANGGGMKVFRVHGALLIVAAAPFLSACDRCSFRLLERQVVEGTLPCCGAWVNQDVSVPPGTNRQVDISNTRSPGEAGLIDIWLVPTDCERLFDGPYPGAVPRCRVIIGPVAPGTVSSRIKLDAGTYRAVLQSHSTNTEATSYVWDIGSWGNDCRPLTTTSPR